jgi:hypothetical protein
MFSKGILECKFGNVVYILYIYIYSMIINAPIFMQHEEPKANDVNDATLMQG